MKILFVMAREENIDLILSEGLVYYSKRVDMSDKVIERLRKKFEAR